jgi:hypothetical protein
MSIRVRLIGAQGASTTAVTLTAMAAWVVPVLRTSARSGGCGVAVVVSLVK